MANEKKGLNISNAIKIGALITAVILIAFSANYIISTETTNTEQWNNFDSFENTEMKEKLNEKNLPEPIEKSFSEKGLPLSNPKISVEGHNEEWKIIGEDQTYLIKKENEKLHAYSKFITVATASNLEYFAEELAGEKIQIRTIVPAGQCPGHFDTKPKDVEAVKDAELVLWNGLETWLSDLIDSSGNEEVMKNKSPNVPWGPTWGAKKYVENTSDALIEAYPHFENSIKKNEENLLYSIDQYGDNLTKRAEKKETEDVKVISQKFKVGFVKWLGFEVVKTYISPEKLSPSEMDNLIKVAKKENVRIIVSNKPTDTTIGEKVTNEADIEHVILRTWPGSGEEGETYFDMIENNSEKLFTAMHKQK